MSCSRPRTELLKEQAAWLSPLRTRALRAAGIAQRESVLELGCGPGLVTSELSRRAAGQVHALDCSFEALLEFSEVSLEQTRLCAKAEQLPFLNSSFDFVFSQCALIWMDLPLVLREIVRVLQPGGAMLFIEPDYGGMIEYPSQIAVRDIWCKVLTRLGADPMLARKIPFELKKYGFSTKTLLIPELKPASVDRFEFLAELPLEQAEQEALAQAQSADQELRTRNEAPLAHLPFFVVLGEK